MALVIDGANNTISASPQANVVFQSNVVFSNTTTFSSNVNFSGSSVILASPTISTPTITSPIISSANLTSMNSSVTTAGGAVSFNSAAILTTYSGIPSWAKRITLVVYSASLSGSAYIRVQFGTSGGLVTSGYTGYVGLVGTTNVYANFSNGFIFHQGAISGMYQWMLVDPSNNTWSGHGNFGYNASTNDSTSAGGVILTNPLTQIQINSSNGTDTFTAGKFNLYYD